MPSVRLLLPELGVPCTDEFGEVVVSGESRRFFSPPLLALLLPAGSKDVGTGPTEKELRKCDAASVCCIFRQEERDVTDRLRRSQLGQNAKVRHTLPYFL